METFNSFLWLIELVPVLMLMKWRPLPVHGRMASR
jgi:hypothetical protein